MFSRALAPLLSFRRSVRNWAHKRQGTDADEIRLRSGRIYILPSAQGLAFGFLLLAMLIGALNYNNSLGLAATFLLAGLAVVSMHHCHRNLTGLRLNYAGDQPAFAGQDLIFKVSLVNDSAATRFGLTLRRDQYETETIHLEPGQRRTLDIRLHSTSRGWLSLDRFGLYTTFPLGLFHCWTWIHPQWRAIVYPKPAPAGLTPPPQLSDTGGQADLLSGDADFAGLRNFRDGDSPRHIAWKAFARDETLLVKQYAGNDVSSRWFDFDSLDQMDLEARLSQLARWVIDAHNRGHAWGLRLPDQVIEPDIGAAHRDRCLKALALV